MISLANMIKMWPIHLHLRISVATVSSSQFPLKIALTRSERSIHAPPFSRQSPQGCLQNSTNAALVEHISLTTTKSETSAASFLHFLVWQQVLGLLFSMDPHWLSCLASGHKLFVLAAVDEGVADQYRDHITNE